MHIFEKCSLQRFKCQRNLETVLYTFYLLLFVHLWLLLFGLIVAYNYGIFFEKCRRARLIVGLIVVANSDEW